MGVLVRFPIEQRRVGQTLRTRCDAEILIFNGVTIERAEFDLATRLEPPGSRVAASQLSLKRDGER